ncbi:hypothetical protein HDU83_008978 [Entophlyctis luteolus]|nr:hypothetical protein HDU83_008978 [Entophlyctis luteolus]
MPPKRNFAEEQHHFDSDEFQGASPEPKKRSYLDDEDPVDKRRRQVRQRQQNYTEDLEARVISLAATLKAHGIQVPPSVNDKQFPSTGTLSACCRSSSELAAENKSLKLQLDEQTQRCQDLEASLAMAALHSARAAVPSQPVLGAHPVLALKQQATSPTNTANFSEACHATAPDMTDGLSVVTSVNPRQSVAATPMRTAIAGLVENDDISSSAEMFGSLQLETFAQTLMTIGVREDWANEFVQLLEEMALCTNRCTLRSLLVKYSKLYNGVVECLGEHSHIVEAVEAAKLRGSNSSHWKHWYQSIAANLEFDSILDINAPNMPEEQAQVVRDMEAVQKEMSAIPSIADRGHLVQALCVEFAALTTCSPDQYEKHYANVLAIQGLLQALCETGVERRKFMLTFETARDVAKKFVDSRKAP